MSIHDTFGQTPQTMLDSASGRPVVPRVAVVRLMIWCAIEGTLFAFALHPTMSQVVSDLTGYTVNPTVLIVLLGIFLTIIVAGVFGCIQVLIDAIEARHIGNIASLTLTELMVAAFQVSLLHRVMVEALTPWLAQGGLTFGRGAMIALASLVWFSMRGMTWFLFGRSGAPALIAVLNRQAGTHR